MTKCNIAQPGPSLTYRVETAPARAAAIRYMVGERHPETGAELTEPLDFERPIPAGPTIVWEGPTTITADDIVSTKPDMGALTARAVEWLRKMLADGPVPATEIESKAEPEGISYRTIQFAKSRLKVESRRVASNGGIHWVWSLPAGG